MQTTIQSPQPQYIPLNRLKKSPRNVRKKKHSKEHIERLATTIGAEGQIQNLVVETERDGSGNPTGCYLTTVGEGRRLAHLLLAEAGKIQKDHPILCVVNDSGNATAVSLSENDDREGMHPADQVMAFKKLADEGMSLEDIAARKGISSAAVKQRLKLASLAPEFIDLCREDKVSLEILMALALTDDHAMQRRVWKSLPKLDRSASAIRRRLTQHELPISDRIVQFVGIEAYQKAGGPLREDAFAEEGPVAYAMDVELAQRLAKEKLDAKAADLKAKGCAWVEVMFRMEYGTLNEYTRLNRLPFKPTAEHKKAAGAIVSIESNGKLLIESELLKPEDAARFKRAQKGKGKGTGKEAKPRGVHSAALLRRLAAHRTLGLQIALSEQPDIALVAMTHALLLEHFARSTYGYSAIHINPKEKDVAAYGVDVEKSPARVALAALEAKLRSELPKKPEEWLEWLFKRPQKKVMDLMAFCISLSLDGIQDSERPHPTDRLAKAARLDMRKWWKATAETYFDSVPKAQTLAVIKEAVSEKAAAELSTLKKGALAKAAENRLNGADWLPSLLRPQAH